MAILRTYSPVLHFDDDQGNPLAGGWLCTYLAGTSTPVATYADSTGTLNDVQIELDGRGECEVWLDSSKKYKFVVLDHNKDGSHPVIVKDNVSVPAGGGGGSSVDITSTDGTVTITPSAGAFDLSIQSALDTKKDKQQNSDTSSTATKTLTRITQDANGVIYTHFDDIDFPEQVQADYEQENPLSIDFIKNKPKITEWKNVPYSYFGDFSNLVGDGNVVFMINKSLLLMELSFWFYFSTDSTQIRKGFVFNDDIPLVDVAETKDACFGGDFLGKTTYYNSSYQYPVLASVRPHVYADSTQSKSITIRPYGVNTRHVDSFCRIIPVKKEIITYLEGKGFSF